MNFIKQIPELVDGLKTYIMLCIGLLGIILWSQDVLTQEAFQIWMGTIGLGAIAGFRSALKKIE